MLSVLIPIHNFDVRLLVSELNDQLNDANIEFEIRCYDDQSYFDFRMINQRIAAYPNVLYRELPENIGRSKIRNLLAEEAKYDQLLFLDCDVQTGGMQFIQDYLDNIEANTVICGGILYNNEAPSNSQLLLHWNYGSEREVSDLAIRNSSPYKSFLSANFCLPKSVFEAIKFDETITGYGHEDTLFGIHLKQQQIAIKHIQNPIYHLGLKSTHHFLESAHDAVKNLATLINKDLVTTEINLYKAYKGLKMLGLANRARKKLNKKRNFYLNQLYSNTPEIKNLDKLKLLWLIEEIQQQKSAT